MIIVDTEYTTWPGALESGWSLPGQRREIVQISAIRVSDYEETAFFDKLVIPKINFLLSDLFIELTGIQQEDIIENGDSFAQRQKEFLDFCGADPIICMNADETVFRENCGINDVDFPFRSFHRLRPFLEAQGVDLTGISSGDLHTLTASPLVGHTHNALHDVRSMACWLRHAGRPSIDQLPTGAPTSDPRSIRTSGSDTASMITSSG
jgi:inhibitor of KinA sporulation pathway (predicted exonuclease)